MSGASSPSELLAGFRLERRLGERTWEAVQPELGRRVALRRLEPGAELDVGRWPERPGVVALYAAVSTPDGRYVATRLIPGARTLAECARAGSARRRRWLAQVADALEGSVHGSLTEDVVLIDADGRAWVTGFGQAPATASAQDDLAALERMRATPRRANRRAPVVVVAALAAAGGATALAVVDGDPPPPPPAPLPGATVYGSLLEADGVRTVDCAGAAPSGSSLPCTVMQTSLGSRPLVVREASLVRRWSVRGAVGRVRLQVLVAREGGYFVFNATPARELTDPARTYTFTTSRQAPQGSRFALEVTPGAAVGIRTGVPEAVTDRFASVVRSAVARPDARTVGGEELMLRVDVQPRPRG